MICCPGWYLGIYGAWISSLPTHMLLHLIWSTRVQNFTPLPRTCAPALSLSVRKGITKNFVEFSPHKYSCLCQRSNLVQWRMLLWSGRRYPYRVAWLRLCLSKNLSYIFRPRRQKLWKLHWMSSRGSENFPKSNKGLTTQFYLSNMVECGLSMKIEFEYVSSI